MKKGYIVLIVPIFALALAYGSFLLVGANTAHDTMNSLEAAQSAASGGSIWSSNSYSGDDIYDPAAGGLPQQVIPNTGSELPLAAPTGSYSGDDAYDPAAGNLVQPVISNTGGELPLAAPTGSYSGDDAYDPAAGD